MLIEDNGNKQGDLWNAVFINPRPIAMIIELLIFQKLQNPMHFMQLRCWDFDSARIQDVPIEDCLYPKW